jgi:hypothetical protein
MGAPRAVEAGGVFARLQDLESEADVRWVGAA